MSLYRYNIHTHAFAPKIAAKATKQLHDHYRIAPAGDGTYEDLAPRLRKNRIDYCCIHSAATRGDQVIPANQWAVSLQQHPGVISFGTMHPDFEDLDGQLAYLWDNGIRGIKLHPDFQGFRLDDYRLEELYGAAEGNFTMMIHVGDLPPPFMNPSCPYKVAALKRRYPKLQLIAAHFGGYHQWEYVVDAMKGLEIYMDTSSALFGIPQHDLEHIWNSFPRHLFLFGSDYPLFDDCAEAQLLQERLRLSDTELEQVFTNANALNLVTTQKPSGFSE